ncbi:hypothetical protein NQ176_g1884 [Zarea fungicola]|uniref:Uncharacterized protein n=1 Tax=Zarea fungicola TaxID=93591 RepID=A0ACC1NRW3_9HYPO|nr:hypothetical protein NQ176_g1884 [Lecanicillium fungicola]
MSAEAIREGLETEKASLQSSSAHAAVSSRSPPPPPPPPPLPSQPAFLQTPNAVNNPNAPLSKIEAGLYLGDRSSSHLNHILEKEITAVVSLDTVRPDWWHTADWRKQVPPPCHLYIDCEDSILQNIVVYFADVCDFIEKCRSSGSVVLVHCQAGASRSATAVVAYIMRKYRLSVNDALARVKESRKVNPNKSFMAQLGIWEETGYDIWQDAARTIPKGPYNAYLTERVSWQRQHGLADA